MSKIKAIKDCDTTWTAKEMKYLRTALLDGEDVLHVVSGVMQQNSATVSGNNRSIGANPSNSARTWLMALTNQRIILVNRHLLVGTECMAIPLESINSISFQSRMISSSISIMHGSDGIVVDNILKGTEKPFVDKANEAIRKIKASSAPTPSASAFSVADEIAKFKLLLDQGIITQDEFDAQKAKLLK